MDTHESQCKMELLRSLMYPLVLFLVYHMVFVILEAGRDYILCYLTQLSSQAYSREMLMLVF